MPRPDIAFETLLEQLHGDDWMQRCDAARLLGQSRDPRAVEALLPDLSDPDWRVRRNAAQALGALRDPRAVDALLQALQDRTITVRQRAIVALGRIKDPRALPALLEVLLANKHESYDAGKAIRKFGKKALPEIASAFDRSGNLQLMLLLIELKYEKAFDLLLRLLANPDPQAQLTAAREFGKRGNRKAIPYLMEQLDHGDPAIQSEAIRALGQLGATEAIPALLSLLTDDDIYGPRSGLYHATTEAFQNLAGIAEEIKQAFPGKYPAMFNMGGAALSLPEAMGLLGDNPLQQMLFGLNRETPRAEDLPPGIPADLVSKVVEEMRWKFGLMFADARDASQDRVKRLIELLKADSSLTRSAAALTLPWYSDEASLVALEQAREDPDETVRQAAIWASRALRKVILYRRQAGS